MANEINNGGPAFPVSLGGPDGHQDGAGTWQHPGMSLLDAFAISIAPGMLDVCREDDLQGARYLEHVARLTYELAGELIKARGATHGN